jgi:hypothetical protein
MKRFTNKLTGSLLLGLAVICTLPACQKGFNTKSYAPVKPLPSFDGYNSSNSIESASLVDYWNFSGSLTDSVSKLPGVATGTTFASGISGQGLQCNLNDYAICQPSAAIAKLQSCSVSTWVNTGPPTTGVIDYFTLANTGQFWGNMEMFFDNGSTNTDAHVRIHLSQNGSDNTFAAEVPGCFGAWVNLIFTYDVSGACTLYLNGKSVATGTAGTLTGPLAFTNVGSVIFGCTQFTTNPSQTTATGSQPWAAFMVGKIDQVRVYNTVLTANEAAALYNLENLGR